MHKPLLESQVALVTGAAGALGKAISAGLADAGAVVVLLDRDEAQLDVAVKDLERQSDTARFFAEVADITSEDDVRRAIARSVERFGRLDILVNNAGISPVFARAESMALDDWRRILDVNLTGTFLCAREAALQMIKQGGGRIINTSSVVGGVGTHHLAAYCASKGGVVALTQALAADWARYDIRVNAVAPGYLDSPLGAGVMGNERLAAEIMARVPQKRWGAPDELVGAYLYLASPASSFTTGQTIYVDGGYSAV